MERQNQKVTGSGRLNVSGISSPEGTLAFNSIDDYDIIGFPREFKRTLFEYFDKRFILVLLGTAIIHIASVSFYLINPPTEKILEHEVRRVQQRFASLILEEKPVQMEEEQPMFTQSDFNQPNEGRQIDKRKRRGSGTSRSDSRQTGSSARAGDQVEDGSPETKTASAGERAEASGLASSARSRSRNQISQDVSTKGILGVLTAGSSTGVEDVLGDGNASNDNLADVLEGVGGLTKGGTSGSGGSSAGGGTAEGNKSLRGGRASQAGTIDNMIGDLGTASTHSVQRKGKLMVSEQSTVEHVAGSTKAPARDRDVVMAVVNAHSAAILSCYQRALKLNPHLRGKIVVRFTIDYLGKISHVEVVSSTLNNPSVERCVVSRIRRWDDFGVIDQSKGDTTIRQVYTFGY